MEKKPLKRTDIADWIQCSVRQTYRLKNFPSPIRIGRLVRWKMEDVEDWINGLSADGKGKVGRPRSSREEA